MQRSLAIAEYQTLVDEKTSELQADLFDSGTATAVLCEWVSVLEAPATDSVDGATIESEARAISDTF